MKTTSQIFILIKRTIKDKSTAKPGKTNKIKPDRVKRDNKSNQQHYPW